MDGFTKTRGRVFPDREGNYRKGNSDFLLKLFYYYNLDFYNFIDFKMVIYWYILVWFSLWIYYALILVVIYTISLTSIVRIYFLDDTISMPWVNLLVR